MHGVYNTVCVFIITCLHDTFRGIVIGLAGIQLFTLVQLLDASKEEIHNHISKLLCFLQLVVNVRKAAYMLDINHLIIKVHIYIVTIALQGLDLGIAQKLLQYGTSATAGVLLAILVNRILIEEDDDASLPVRFSSEPSFLLPALQPYQPDLECPQATTASSRQNRHDHH